MCFRYSNDQLYVIDVSQSVEANHVESLKFLRVDCTNVTNFFRKNKVSTMTDKELFDFITDVMITDVDEYLDKAMEIASQRVVNHITEKEKVDQEVSPMLSNHFYYVYEKIIIELFEYDPQLTNMHCFSIHHMLVVYCVSSSV